MQIYQYFYNFNTRFFYRFYKSVEKENVTVYVNQNHKVCLNNRNDTIL